MANGNQNPVGQLFQGEGGPRGQLGNILADAAVGKQVKGSILGQLGRFLNTGRQEAGPAARAPISQAAQQRRSQAQLAQSLPQQGFGQVLSGAIQGVTRGQQQNAEEQAAQEVQQFMQDNPEATMSEVAAKFEEVGLKHGVPEAVKRGRRVRQQFQQQRQQRLQELQAGTNIAELFQRGRRNRISRLSAFGSGDDPLDINDARKVLNDVIQTENPDQFAALVAQVAPNEEQAQAMINNQQALRQMNTAQRLAFTQTAAEQDDLIAGLRAAERVKEFQQEREQQRSERQQKNRIRQLTNTIQNSPNVANPVDAVELMPELLNRDDVDFTPQEIITAIQQVFPDVSEEQLARGFSAVQFER